MSNHWNVNIHPERRGTFPTQVTRPRSIEERVQEILSCTSTGRQFLCPADQISALCAEFPRERDGKRYGLRPMLGRAGMVQLTISPVPVPVTEPRREAPRVSLEGLLIGFHRFSPRAEGSGAPVSLDH